MDIPKDFPCQIDSVEIRYNCVLLLKRKIFHIFIHSSIMRGIIVFSYILIRKTHDFLIIEYFIPDRHRKHRKISLSVTAEIPWKLVPKISLKKHSCTFFKFFLYDSFLLSSVFCIRRKY